MSSFPRPGPSEVPQSLVATRTAEAVPIKRGIPWSCLLIGIGNLLAIALLLVLFNARMTKMEKDVTAAKSDTTAARTDAAAAKTAAESASGLLQSIGQALNGLKASGSLTPEQVAAIAAAIAANQAAKGAAKTQAGTTPGIPGSRSGGGTSTTPGVPGSAARPVVSQTIPPPHSSDTSKCLLTANVAQILKLDGTICPP